MNSKSMIEQHPLGATVAGHLAVEWIQRQNRCGHHSMKLVIAVQFWEGDKAQAMRLARLIADIEPDRRDDVSLVLAGRYDIREDDPEVAETGLYCGRKFRVGLMRSHREAVGHPDGCFGLWAGTAENCYAAYAAGAPYDNVLFVEADGVPTRFDWIDFIKRQHQINLESGAYVTGPLMIESPFYPAHINGTMVMHMPAWANLPSLHTCPAGQAWDCYHGSTLVRVSGRRPGIANLYGTHSLSLSVFKTLARDYAWVASVKDGSAYECAQTLIYDEWVKLLRTAWPEKKEARFDEERKDGP